LPSAPPRLGQLQLDADDELGGWDAAPKTSIASPRPPGAAIPLAMTYLLVKALLSGFIIAVASEIARRSPGLGALIVSLPLVSILAILWLWRDTGDTARIAAHAQATFWYVLPSLPMFLALPALLRAGVNFWLALLLACALTIALYLAMTALAPRLGLKL
jgi:hypothetical protein